MPSTIQSVAVVGAAGLVGRSLLNEFERLGVPVTAVIRGDPEICVDGDFHSVLTDAMEQPAHRFRTVVNLAYPTSGLPFEQPAANAALFELIEHLIADGGHLVQVSTQAVFGMAVDRPVYAGHVARVRDTTYVELKIQAEHKAEEMQRGRKLSLDIVRLGNVWGEATRWALPVVQRLLTGRPLLVQDAPGYSNATDVHNVSSYLGFLVDRGPDGVCYHHLSEFSSIPWRWWVEPIASCMGVEAVTFCASDMKLPNKAPRELITSVAPMAPRSLYRRMAEERVLGSWTRSMIRSMPPPVRRRLQSNDQVYAAAPIASAAEANVLAIFSGGQEFASVTHAGWMPPISQEESLQRTLSWLDWDAV